MTPGVMVNETASSTGSGIVTSMRLRFPLGKSGKPFSGVSGSMYRFRRLVEAELERQGRITVDKAHRLATACRAFRASLRCHLIVAKKGLQPEGELSLADFLALTDREVKHSETVDRCLTALGIGRDEQEDLISALYRPVALSGDSTPITGGPDAAEAKPCGGEP